MVLIANDLHRWLFTTFVKEHFGADVQFVPSYTAGKKFVAGSFLRRKLFAHRSARAREPAFALLFGAQVGA